MIKIYAKLRLYSELLQKVTAGFVLKLLKIAYFYANFEQKCCHGVKIGLLENQLINPDIFMYAYYFSRNLD
ncbi:MAG: hypothetical protein ACK4YV_14695 [Emticicia sp.]